MIQLNKDVIGSLFLHLYKVLKTVTSAAVFAGGSKIMSEQIKFHGSKSLFRKQKPFLHVYIIETDHP